MLLLLLLTLLLLLYLLLSPTFPLVPSALAFPAGTSGAANAPSPPLRAAQLRRGAEVGPSRGHVRARDHNPGDGAVHAARHDRAPALALRGGVSLPAGRARRKERLAPRSGSPLKRPTPQPPRQLCSVCCAACFSESAVGFQREGCGGDGGARISPGGALFTIKRGRPLGHERDMSANALPARAPAPAAACLAV